MRYRIFDINTKQYDTSIAINQEGKNITNNHNIIIEVSCGNLYCYNMKDGDYSLIYESDLVLNNKTNEIIGKITYSNINGWKIYDGYNFYSLDDYYTDLGSDFYILDSIKEKEHRNLEMLYNMRDTISFVFRADLGIKVNKDTLISDIKFVEEPIKDINSMFKINVDHDSCKTIEDLVQYIMKNYNIEHQKQFDDLDTHPCGNCIYFGGDCSIDYEECYWSDYE